MNAIHEFALLFAVAVPVLLIVGINLFLVLGGERGTLLLPGAGAFPAMETSAGPVHADLELAAIEATAANDTLERKAA